MRFFVIAFLLLFHLNVHAAAINTYWSGSYIEEAQLVSKLKSNGFEVVGRHEFQGNPIIVATNSELKKMASGKMRGFIAAWHFLINKKDKTVTTRNPAYFLRAMLQSDYKSGAEESLQKSLKSILGELKPSKDQLEQDDLAGYHFMMAMPYYEDMLEVAQADNEKLNEKISAHSNVVYKIQGSNYNLYGVRLSEKTEGFINKLGVEDRSLVLPYAVLVQNGKAWMLHAKYYLALSFPQLSLGQFMVISNIPDDIEDEIEKMFK